MVALVLTSLADKNALDVATFADKYAVDLPVALGLQRRQLAVGVSLSQEQVSAHVSLVQLVTLVVLLSAATADEDAAWSSASASRIHVPLSVQQAVVVLLIGVAVLVRQVGRLVQDRGEEQVFVGLFEIVIGIGGGY